MYKMDEGFVIAQSDNLPRVDSVMVADFFMNNIDFASSETRGVKLQRSGNEQYGDTSVGFVQLKREQNVCTVKAKVCPEHRIKAKQYNVVLLIDEKSEKVINATCFDCAASAGGCKHAVAFLMWVHRRSEEPAVTEVQSYWCKSKLAAIGSSKKYITAAEFGTDPQEQTNEQENVAQEFFTDIISTGISNSNTGVLYKYFVKNIPPLYKMGLHFIMLELQKGMEQSFESFQDICLRFITPEMCLEASLKTQGQSEQQLWHELRYGRITASKVYTAVHCKNSPTFVQQVIGAMKIQTTEAMKRGMSLEKEVFCEVNRQYKLNFKGVGFRISDEYPFLGASPDGVSDDYVLEIKCPSKEKTFHDYILKSGNISAKCKAQIQVQMCLFKKKKGLFCVADVNFEHNKKIHCLRVDYEEEYVQDLIVKSKLFWCDKIYPILLNSAKINSIHAAITSTSTASLN